MDLQKRSILFPIEHIQKLFAKKVLLGGLEVLYNYILMIPFILMLYYHKRF